MRKLRLGKGDHHVLRSHWGLNTDVLTPKPQVCLPLDIWVVRGEVEHTEGDGSSTSWVHMMIVRKDHNEFAAKPLPVLW